MGMKCGDLAQGKTEQILFFLINRTRSFTLQSVSNLLVPLECNINAIFKRDTFT